MPHVSVHGNQFYYQQTGDGPDVVLLHAVTSNMAVWVFIGIIDTLAQDFRVTAYDLRGHGHSDATPEGYTSANMAADLRGVMQELNVGPAYLVGHSFGAVVALHTAALYPGHVRGVILSDPYFPGLRHLEPDLGQSHVWKDVRQTFQHADIDVGERVDFTKLFRLVADLTSEQLDRIKQAVGPGPARWIAGLPKLADTTCGADVFREAGLTPELMRSVRQPVVALYDEHTAFGSTRRWLEENLLDCTIDVVPGAQHVAPLQNSAEFIRLVQHHLKVMTERDK